MSRTEPSEERRRLRELAGLFLRLGATGFGGPAAHIAMMHEEVVTRRRWLEEEEFLDLLGATSLIPGPNSTEMAIHVGLARARWKGLLVAGISFVLPAVVVVLALAWAYVRYGATPAGEGLLYGIEPVVVAIVARALVGLGRTVARGSPLLLGVGAVVLTLYLLGVNELGLLLGAGAVVVVARAARSLVAYVGVPPALGAAAALLHTVAPAPRAPLELERLFLLFLKFGAVVYGSGYVLLAFLRGDLVTRLGWLTERQLLDALAVGQLTPGPVFTTATFVGYVLGGVGGALLATLGIFLPGFVFVAGLQQLVRWMRRSSWAGGLLDGVNAAALGLMAGVTWHLGREAIVDLPTLLLAVGAGAALVRFQVNSGWLVLAGGVAGLALRLAV